MPKSYESYSITYRPYPVEFERTRKLFVDCFVQKWKDAKYIISPESAGQDAPNHFQIYLRFDKLKRQDTFKKTMLRVIQKWDLTNEKVALKVNGISRDENFTIGYVVKEHKTFDNLIVKGISTGEIVKAKDYYLEQVKVKKLGVQRVSVNKRNFMDCFKNYVAFNKIVIDVNVCSCPSNLKVLSDDEEVKEEEDSSVCYLCFRKSITDVIALMALDDYYLIPIVNARSFPQVVSYIVSYYDGKMKEFVYRSSISDYV